MKTLVYRYGLLPPTEQPEAVAEQIRLAHQYQNQLIEIERTRRGARDAILGAVPAVAVVDSRIAALNAELEAERGAMSAERSAERNRDAGDPTRARNILAELKELWQRRKEEVKAALAQPGIQSDLAAVQATHKASVKAARAACGVYWGTYLPIEAAVEQAAKAPALPRFQRWTGDGAVAIQLIHGLRVEDALRCQDTRLRLSLAALAVPGRGGKPLPRLWLRIGSDGRAPVFAQWPVIVHRPLPPEGLIKWAKVVRRGIAGHEHWSVHFTVVLPDSAEQEGTPLAVNLRWSKSTQQGQATTLAADWHDGTQGGEVHVEPAVVSQLRKADDLRSIRDKNFEAAKASLTEALKTLTAPEGLRERMGAFHAWKAQGRLAALVRWWRDNRFAGDADAWGRVEAWRRQDKHLWDWEANARRKALARRRDGYRVFAARMARAHKILVLEKLNLARLAAKPKPEEEREVNAQASAQRFATAPSELRSALVSAFRREGGRIVEVPAGLTSREMLGHYRATGGQPVARPPQRSERSKRLGKNKAKTIPSASLP
jgi:hypothetical protein